MPPVLIINIGVQSSPAFRRQRSLQTVSAAANNVIAARVKRIESAVGQPFPLPSSGFPHTRAPRFPKHGDLWPSHSQSFRVGRIRSGGTEISGARGSAAIRPLVHWRKHPERRRTITRVPAQAAPDGRHFLLRRGWRAKQKEQKRHRFRACCMTAILRIRWIHLGPHYSVW